MKNLSRYAVLTGVIAMTLGMTQVQAAQGGVSGPPDNPGDGGGQGKPENPGGGGGKPEHPGRGKGGLYSDLLVLHRSADGLPLLSGVPVGTSEEEVTAAAEGHVACLQPITAAWVDDPVITDYAKSVLPPLTNPLTNPADGKVVSPVPLGGTGVAGEECDVAPDYTAFTQEVAFGRLNLGRSPIHVLDKQLADVLDVLSSASTLTLDAAGRLVADGVEIDSPGQNLAIFAELEKHGHLQTDNPLPGEYGYLDRAASALGAAADKVGLINLDLVVYENRILNIPNETEFGTLQGNGTEGESGEKYYNYGGYSYNRAFKYPGCVEGFFVVGDQSLPFSGPLMHFVFADQGYTGSNVYGFATSADDSRRVIEFVHDNIVTHVDPVGETTDGWCTLVDPRS